MAIEFPDFTAQAANHAMIDGLTSMVREKLRDRIMDRLNPDIDAAVEAGLATFKISIERMTDPIYLEKVVRVLIEDRRRS